MAIYYTNYMAMSTTDSDMKPADHIIDLGPDGGDQGGFVVTKGNPLDIIKNPNGSHTARYLKQYLDNGS